MTVLTVGKESLRTVYEYSTAFSTTVGKAVPHAFSCPFANVFLFFFLLLSPSVFFLPSHPEPTSLPSPLYFLPPLCYGECGEAVGKAREHLFSHFIRFSPALVFLLLWKV